MDLARNKIHGFSRKMGKLKNRSTVPFKITIDPVWTVSKIIHDPVYFVSTNNL